MCETLYSICEQVISIFCNNILFVRVYCFLVNHRFRSVALWNNTVNMLKIVSNLRKGKSCVEQKLAIILEMIFNLYPCTSNRKNSDI